MDSQNYPRLAGEFSDDCESVEIALTANEVMAVSREAWLAHLKYRSFINYSRDTEKTDFTYSKLSKFSHVEIIPGFVVRPNLSRPPISSVGISRVVSSASHTQ